MLFLVVRSDENKTTLSEICHPHKSAAWAACEVGDMQANKRKSATGLKGGFLGGVLRVLGFVAGNLGYIHHHPPSLPWWTHHSLLCGYRSKLSQLLPRCSLLANRAIW